MTERTHTFYRDDYSVFGSHRIEGGNPGWIVSINDGKMFNSRFWISGGNFHEIEDRDLDPKGIIHTTIIGKPFEGVPEVVSGIVHDAIFQWEKELEGKNS
jgi:hypothetical protein